MIRNKLMINDSKTEFVLIGTRQQLCKLQPCTISVEHDTITASTQVKNLGCCLDSHLNMSKHVTSDCKSAFFHLYNIRRIKNYLSRENLLTLVHAFITSRLDYCNSVLYGVPKEQISKLQRVQNAAARLVMALGNIPILLLLCMIYIGSQFTRAFILRFCCWRLKSSTGKLPLICPTQCR